MWVDENAFGLLIAYFGVEEEEYALEREEFVARFDAFRERSLGYVAAHPLGQGARALDLGHALYFEVGDGDQAGDPLAWMRGLRAALAPSEADPTDGYATVAVISHGSRWVPEAEHAAAAPRRVGDVVLTEWARPSEPLRRALHAEAATRPDADGAGGWGPGLYFDTEAVESLGRTPKNAPTAWETAGAAFYRVGR